MSLEGNKMGLAENYDDLLSKMEKACYDENLKLIRREHEFPIIYSFIEEPDEQIRFGEEDEPETNNAFSFIFGEELTFQSPTEISISDEVLSRLKNMAKKLHYLYLQVFFADHVLFAGSRK